MHQIAPWFYLTIRLYSALSLCLYQGQQASRAVSVCGEVLQSDPENVNALKDRAEAYIQEEQYEEGMLSRYCFGVFLQFDWDRLLNFNSQSQQGHTKSHSWLALFNRNLSILVDKTHEEYASLLKIDWITTQVWMEVVLEPKCVEVLIPTVYGTLGVSDMT